VLLVGEPDDLDAIVAALREFPGWPADDTKDREYARQLRAAFPGLDIIDEIHAWRLWMIDHDAKGRGVNTRARFTNWCRNAVRFGRRGAAARSGAGGGRAGTRARTAADFGDTSERATGW